VILIPEITDEEIADELFKAKELTSCYDNRTQ
jgi:hypothetical protein